MFLVHPLHHIIWNWFSIEYKGKLFALTSHKMLLHHFDIISIICKFWVFFKSFDILLIITQKCNLLEYMCIIYVTSHRSILIVQFSLFFFFREHTRESFIDVKLKRELSEMDVFWRIESTMDYRSRTFSSLRSSVTRNTHDQIDKDIFPSTARDTHNWNI